MSFLNVSAYRFVDLDDLPSLRDRLDGSAAAAGLKGTILIAREGINLFLAGAEPALRGWIASTLHGDARFADLATKDSFSDAPPFRRLKVRIKDEIIRMGRPAIRPQRGRAPSVAPAVLARWLAQGHDDAGREIALLDTRNAFEVDAGTFVGAHDWRLAKFSDFPAAFEARRAELSGKAVVSFCTGGIRCEKAALYMGERALPGVLQLEGGILGYFAATGGAAPGWEGRCFVFDERRTVDAGLAPDGPPPAERATIAAPSRQVGAPAACKPW
ncbi:MAG: sulfurtransferase [Burkholderiaceae bacterium]